MRLIARALLCAGVLLVVTGCNPATERRYFTEGAGVDLYTADRANQVELLNQYIKFICGQAGPDCGGSWSVFVQAGMNDIDLRCDGFLTWLDARRRDKEPILSELSALNTAAHTIMTVSGVGPKALDIVTAAFGLATATYTNWNSRLLIAVNQSTVQDVVYTSQGQYRDKIKNFPINNQPTAIYLLRNYLRLCLPTTIEANINTSTTLVQSGNPMSAMHSTVVKSVRPTIIRSVNAPIRRFTPPPPPVGRVSIGPYEAKMQQKEMNTILATLGCTGTDLGPAGSPARKALSKFLTDNGQPASNHVTNDIAFTIRELKSQGKKGTCGG